VKNGRETIRPLLEKTSSSEASPAAMAREHVLTGWSIHSISVSWDVPSAPYGEFYLMDLEDD
jgi:hypothetical protein